MALGKNDLKAKYKRSADDIAKGLEECIEVFKLEGRTKDEKLPKLMVVTPAIVEEVERKRFGKMEVDFLGANAKSKKLPSLYKKVAERNGAAFVDISDKIKVSAVDGVHLEASEHKKIGEVVYVVIKGLGLSS